MGAATGTPSPECNGSERRGVRGGAAFARRLGPSCDSGAPSRVPGSSVLGSSPSSAQRPPLGARAPPSAPPSGLSSAFPSLGASCKPNIAQPSHVDRSGLGGGRTGLRDARGGGAGTRSLPPKSGICGNSWRG